MTSKKIDTSTNTFLGHLIELRKGLVRGIIAILIATLALFPFANKLYLILAQPLVNSLQLGGGQMIATQVASPFLTPFKLSIISGIFIAMPLLLYQLWSFVAPGLYKHEKRLALPLLLMSIILFYMGMAFAYFIVFPIMFSFLTGTAPEGVKIATDIALYLDFAIKIFFAFGFAFQIPVATVLFILLGFISPKNLRKKRPYIIVCAFILGMLLTPPDIISQVLLAVPVWLLFEIGVWVGKLLQRERYGLSDNINSVAEASPSTNSTDDYAEPTDEQAEQLLNEHEKLDKKLDEDSL